MFCAPEPRLFYGTTHGLPCFPLLPLKAGDPVKTGTARPGVARTGVAVGAALFLVWQSVAIFDVLSRIRPELWGLLALVAFLFNVVVLGAFAVVGFVLPTHRVLPTRYYHIGHPERLSSIYRALRVDLFGRALLATLWRDHAQRRRYFDGSPSGLAHLDVQSRSAEFGHVVPFVLVTFASIRWALGGAFGLAGFAFAFNVLINMYPVLLQRHHRMRVQRLQGLRRARVGRP